MGGKAVLGGKVWLGRMRGEFCALRLSTFSEDRRRWSMEPGSEIEERPRVWCEARSDFNDARRLTKLSILDGDRIKGDVTKLDSVSGK